MALPAPRFDVIASPDAYATPQVDQAIGRVAATIERLGEPLTATQVLALRFDAAAPAMGYDRAQVDAWFHQVALELARRQQAADDHRVLDGRMLLIVLPTLVVLTLLGWWVTR
ncbi:MAG: hypothetical protein KDB63_08405 [Nocardioidaceae bacterium]|nr:hypothetical protein [Nocardioidaceae bacterium]